MKRLLPYLPWYCAVAILIVIFGTIFTVAQQSQRLNANSPQIQMAEDLAAKLDHGKVPLTVGGGKVDMRHSLAPFVIIYDKSGKVVSGTGELDGSVPTIDKGALEAANGQAYNFVTWQPKSGVRIASVEVSANKYYVLSGRSLTEIEKNANTLFTLSALGCVASILIYSGYFLVKRRFL